MYILMGRASVAEFLQIFLTLKAHKSKFFSEVTIYHFHCQPCCPDGPASDGLAADGPAADVPAADGPAADVPADAGPAADGPAAVGPLLLAHF